MARRNAYKANAAALQSESYPDHSRSRGAVYLVSTPIGNPEDITARAITIMRTVKIIAAEDCRVIGRLLARFGIDTEVCSLRPRSQCSNVFEKLKPALMNGDDVALVCDAGTPLIADPGSLIVKAAIELQCRIVPVPGAVAAIAALTASGLRTQRFAFDGFPPRTKSDRYSFFSSLAAEKRTIILYETRTFLPNTLQSLVNGLGADRRVAVVRDLTRTTETTCRGRLGDMASQFETAPPRGEYVLVIEGLCTE